MSLTPAFKVSLHLFDQCLYPRNGSCHLLTLTLAPVIEFTYTVVEDVYLLLELGLCVLYLLVELLDCVLVFLDSVHEGGYLMVAPQILALLVQLLHLTIYIREYPKYLRPLGLQQGDCLCHPVNNLLVFLRRHGLDNLDLRLVRCGLAILVLEHTPSFHQFVSNPIGELVLVIQLVRKQLLDVVVEDVGQNIFVEVQILLELRRCELYAIVDELAYQFVYSPLVVLPIPILDRVSSLLRRLCVVHGVALRYLAVLVHLLEYLPFLMFSCK